MPFRHVTGPVAHEAAGASGLRGAPGARSAVGVGDERPALLLERPQPFSAIGWLVLGALGIGERPADPLDQLTGEVIAGQVAGGDALVEHHQYVGGGYALGGN